LFLLFTVGVRELKIPRNSRSEDHPTFRKW
jgi:hypothetical protein